MWHYIGHELFFGVYYNSKDVSVYVFDTVTVIELISIKHVLSSELFHFFFLMSCIWYQTFQEQRADTHSRIINTV